MLPHGSRRCQHRQPICQMGLGSAGPRLQRSVYVVCVCGANVGGISGTSSRIELLGQPVVVPTVDCPVQGSAQAQECAAHGCGEWEVCVMRGTGAGELLCSRGWWSDTGARSAAAGRWNCGWVVMHAVSSRRPGSVGPASDVVRDVPEGGGTSFGAWVGMDGTMVVTSGAGVMTSNTGDVGMPRAVGTGSHGQVPSGTPALMGAGGDGCRQWSWDGCARLRGGRHGRRNA